MKTAHRSTPCREIEPSSYSPTCSSARRARRRHHMASLFIFSSSAFSQRQSGGPSSDTLKDDLSVEELMNVRVTSVSKRSEKLSETASAIQVITGEDIRKISGQPPYRKRYGSRPTCRWLSIMRTIGLLQRAASALRHYPTIP